MRTTLANISASLLALLYMPHASGAAAIVGRQTVSGAPFPLNVVQSGSTLGVSSSAMFVMTLNSPDDLNNYR